MATRVACPELKCVLVDWLFVLGASQHNFVREASFEVVFLDRHAVGAADVHASRVRRFEEGEAVVQAIEFDEALFDAYDLYNRSDFSVLT